MLGPIDALHDTRQKRRVRCARCDRMITASASVPMPGTASVALADADACVHEWTREQFQREVQPHLPRLYRMCLALCRNGEDAEDLLQNSLMKAYVGRASFEGRGSLAGWLFGIVRHEHDEHVRINARRRSLVARAIEQCAIAVEDLLSAPTPDPETWVGLDQQGAVLMECLQTIPEPYRMVLWLCDVEELPQAEVASVLGIAEGTVKSRHARGRARLRAAYERRSQGDRGRGNHG